MPDIVRIGQNIFSKTAIDRIAGIDLFTAKGFPAGNAVMTMTTGRMQPRHAYTVAFLDGCDTFANFENNPDTFVAGDKRRIGFYRPIAFGGVQVGVTHARRFDFHKDLARCDFGHCDFFDRQGFAKFAD